MTEAEWLTGTDPVPMLACLRGRVSDRKLRLFGVACCRQVWGMLTGEFRTAVLTAERFADGLATKKELASAKKASGEALASVARPANEHCACGAAWSATRGANTAAEYPCWVFTDDAERLRLVVTLREVVGNPYRPAAADPCWRTPAVTGLASAVYGERAFDRLPVLADALEEAGCDDTDILSHLRSDGPHVRGCWALDLVLGKE